jgi:hypothetical protein
MTPERISDFIRPVSPGQLGLCEDLFGYRIVPSDKPIDQLIAVVDREYLDFNPEDKRFHSVVEKVFGYYPNQDQWRELITSSSQNSELKSALLKAVTISAAPATQATPALGRHIIKTKRGKTIIADDVQEVVGPSGYKLIYIGISPSHQYKHYRGSASVSKYKRLATRMFVPTTYIRGNKRLTSKYSFIKNFAKVITIKPENIVSITKA